MSRRMATGDPSGDAHRNHRVADVHKRGQRHHLPPTRNIASGCSLLRTFTLFVVLFFVATFYSVIRLSHVERAASFSIPDKLSSFDDSQGARGETSRMSSTWTFSAAEAEKVQRYFFRTTGRSSPPLTAYTESPLSNSTVPLPLRTHGPDALRSFTYPQVNGCTNLQAMLPTLHTADLDDVYGSNVFNKQPLYSKRFDYAKDASAVDQDPFLPWIHDVFPSNEYVEFIAHNKRKCNTDPKVFQKDLRNLEPQVTIMQPVPVKRIGNDEAKSLAPDLWHDESINTRYRLVSHDEADSDGRETRFICRFYTHTLDKKAEHVLHKVVLGETLSVTPYNYEFANYKKPGSKPMLTPLEKGKDEQIWNSVFHFRCPIPVELQPLIASGKSVVNDVASVFLDLVPIRTRPRRKREGYIPGVKTEFNPKEEWGEGHVLPLIEASGRYSNIPICRPPVDLDAKDNARSNSVAEEQHERIDQENGNKGEGKGQRHYLVGCLWASATYTTRGNGVADTSTSDRLLEWLAYHLYIAKFDHIYVYDNTDAFTNLTSLQAVTDLFPSTRVSRIPWPHRVCNNNRPMHSNPGERSSQYAAEASCRVRYGPHTSWMASFDADEYFLLQGNYSDLQNWLKEGVDNSTHAILSFFQTRAHPIAELMEPYADGHKCGSNVDEAKCLMKRKDLTFLETYDCESTPLPKPDFGWRAKKQLFRPCFVLNHYIHYSVVTKRLLDNPNEVSPRFVEKFPFERRVDELADAFMLHAKTTSPEGTFGWKEKCSRDGGSSCPVGIPWPTEKVQGNTSLDATEDGLKYNCYQHDQVKHVLPKLKSVLLPLLNRYHSTVHYKR